MGQTESMENKPKKTVKRAKTRTFVVAAKSSNYNSFGLRGMILVARTGEAWQVAANTLNECEVGERLQAPLGPVDRHPIWAGFGFEIPQMLPPAPPKVVKEVWAVPDPNVPYNEEDESEKDKP